MEKEICNNPEHHSTCGWCGLDKHFSWKRMALAILLGLFIFCLGIQVGEMRSEFGGRNDGYRMMDRHSEWGRQQQMMQYALPTVVAPATATATVTAPKPVR